MAKDNLRVKVSPPLLKAMGIAPDKTGALDYFDLLGVARTVDNPSTIEAYLKERTKTLRNWQNSTEFGAEAVKLLPILHRAAKILADPKRREAYRREIQLEEKGETAGVVERFRELARVALVGDSISDSDKAQLQKFAAANNIDAPTIRRIIEEVRAQYAATREQIEAEKAAEGPAWEFKLAGEGEEAVNMMLGGLRASGSHLGIGPRKLLEDIMGYGIDLQRAQQLVRLTMAEWYRDMVRVIAGDGAISEVQMKLLIPKAAEFGLSEQEGYEIISNYSLSAMASDEMRRHFQLAEESFDEAEIGRLLEETSVTTRRRSAFERFMAGFNLAPLAIGGVALALLAAGGMAAYTAFSRPGGGGTNDGGNPPPQSTPVVASTTPPPAATATPPPLAPVQPDPQSQMLRFDPEQPGDPPPFEMRIVEVTRELYADYVNSVLEARPPDWPASGPIPAAWNALPVVNVTCNETQKFCLWIADRGGWPGASVRLPSVAEYKRATRGVTIRFPGNPQAPDYWAVAAFNAVDQLNPVKGYNWDKIRTPQGFQVYDLIGNAAEWSSDRQGDQAAVLGGSVEDKAKGFNAMDVRYLPAGERRPWIGFRYVHLPAP